MRIGGFFRWWGRELAEALPQGLRNAAERRLDTLRFEVSDQEIVAIHRVNGTQETLGRLARGQVHRTQESQSKPEPRVQRETLSALIAGLDPKRTRVVVVLAPNLILTKVVRLPLAAEENLREVLSFEMERQTPFRAADVHFDYAIVERDTRMQCIDVRLAVAARAAVDEALELVQGWDLSTSTSGSPGSSAQDGLSLAFVPAGFRNAPGVAFTATLVVLNLAVLVAVIWLPLAHQQRELAELKIQVEQANTAAAAVTALQERADEHETRLRFLLDRKARQPATVVMLEELSRYLDDGTWLHRLEIKKGRVHLQGTSDAASSLIGRLEDLGMFRDVRFDSPVTRDSSSGGDRFQISAEVVEAGEHNAAASEG